MAMRQSSQQTVRFWCPSGPAWNLKKYTRGIPCVYVIYFFDEVVYIGQTQCLRTRLTKHNEWMPIDRFKFTVVADRNQRLSLESRLLARLRPRFNTLIPASYRLRVGAR